MWIKSLESRVPNLDLQSNKNNNNLMKNNDSVLPQDIINLYQSSNSSKNTDSLHNQYNKKMRSYNFLMIFSANFNNDTL